MNASTRPTGRRLRDAGQDHRDNFGVRPEYYILIDFRKFVSLIDKIGGLDVNVGTDLTDLRGNQWVTFEKG
jgi:anionic cell wall polymer biosynthesis LytR-Cps2A-Psr (LCP) family protein